MEDFAYILDYLPQGHHDEKRFKREPLAYALGETEFKLFELTPKPNITLGIGERAYIGKDVEKREQILHVKRRISYSDLTKTSQSELPFVILQVIESNPDRFLKFFNEAQAITTKFHMLELLPGVGKSTMWAIVEEKKKGPFMSFRNIEERVGIKHPEKLISKRIELELSDPEQKYHIFVAK